MKALVFDTFGDATVLQYRELDCPTLKTPLGPFDMLLRMHAIGLNFADVYRRQGRYHLQGEPPYIAGYEGAGEVVELGSELSRWIDEGLESAIRIGDLIGFADVPFANAELVIVNYEKAIPLSKGISTRVAASVLLQGLTAHYLTRDSFQIKSGSICLVHAAAGGVGQLLVQIITMMGGTAIGLTSSEDKAQVAKKCGCKHVTLYNTNWKEEVLTLTNGKGVDVVYDSVGSTLMDSFGACRVGGTVVFYGMAGGDPPHVDPRMLMDTSKTLTGGDLWNVLTSREERIKRANELFSWIESGKIVVESPTEFQLENGKEAHEFLEGRRSTGKILLTCTKE